VRCAIRRGLIKNWEEMDEQRESENSNEIYVFCCRHRSVGRQELKRWGK
jgi:hypothetical protein